MPPTRQMRVFAGGVGTPKPGASDGPWLRLPWVPGTGVAGTVIAGGQRAGSGLAGVALVAQTGDQGGHAERVVVPAAELSRLRTVRTSRWADDGLSRASVLAAE